MMLLRATLLAAFLAAASGLNDHLQGHSVLRVVPDTTEQLHGLRDYLQANDQLDVWLEPRAVGKPVDVSLSAKEREDFVEFVAGLGMEHSVYIEDLHNAVNKHLLSVKPASVRASEFDWTSYHNLEEIYQWLEQLQEKNPDVKIEVVDAGKSYEGRSIKGVVIKFAEKLPVAMVESGIHAREWIGPASATYFIDQILKNKDDTVTNSYEWHIFPSVNPDGYVYTWTKNRMWRKTRSKQWLIFRGVDANRNWPFHWMEAGATKNPASEIYGGMKAESEPETRALRAYVDTLSDRMQVYISLHSYSQLLMFPWGYTSTHAKTHDELNDIALKAYNAIKAHSGTEFTYGNIADTIYPASGSTLDYVYNKCVPNVFVFELRPSADDPSGQGFILPAEQILDAAAETWAGIKVIAQEGKGKSRWC